MIIVKTPLRISFAGGGSDLPSFYRQTEGAVINTTIDKYIYVAIHPHFHPQTVLVKYSRTEQGFSASRLKHPLFRSVLKRWAVSGLEISSTGDVPGGTGLGSSSALAVGLHHGISSYLNKRISREKLAELACQTEIVDLKDPVGKQDQYAAALGGFNFMRFLPNEKVVVQPVKIKRQTKRELEKNLIAFYTGKSRSAFKILATQGKNIMSSEKKFQTLLQMTEQVKTMREALEKDRIERVGPILHQGWMLKKTMARFISDAEIDRYYELAIKRGGSSGGKLLGAGGGGFLLFYCPQNQQEKLKRVLGNLRSFNFKFTDEGSTIILKNDA